MGRTRGFDEAEVLERAAESFLGTGFEGTSLDDLVRATGLHRGSLYQAFGSKRGLFVTALKARLAAAGPDALNLLLVATLELAPRDTEVRGIVREWLGGQVDAPATLGARLLHRAGLDLAAESSSPGTSDTQYEEDR